MIIILNLVLKFRSEVIYQDYGTSGITHVHKYISYVQEQKQIRCIWEANLETNFNFTISVLVFQNQRDTPFWW